MDAGSPSLNSNLAVATAAEENAISGLSQMEYYFLLLLIVLPVKLFFALWAWLGWELFKNN